MELYNGTDIDFRRKPSIMLNKIIENLDDCKYIYEEDGADDIKIIEFAILNQYLPIHLILRPCCKDSFYEYRVYYGHGLCRTLDRYVNYDITMNGFNVLIDFNGKKFSEIPRRFQRKLKESYIDVLIDTSFIYTDNDIITKNYVNALKNAK